MSKNTLRKDKTCLNCRHVVDVRYCPNCGQENSDTRKTFYQLFVHFFEDLTHYENSFWRTIKNLVLKPASLTKEYLSGKRMSYLAPIRLYIFISFVTFFIIALTPTEHEDINHENHKNKNKSNKQEWISNLEKDSIIDKEHGDSLQNAIYKSNEEEVEKLSPKEIKLKRLVSLGILSKTEGDSLINALKKTREIEKNDDERFMNFGYATIEELEKNKSKISPIKYAFCKKSIEINDKYTNQELFEKFQELIVHNFPKVLFIYMPIFAFMLWLFHSKKRWYYFDHGIFTLHYFSFLLLGSLVVFLLTLIEDSLINSVIASTFFGLLKIVCYIWMIYYFYPAHHRFYGETRTVSFFKSSFLFIINMFLILFVLIGYIIYIFFSIN